MLTLIRMMTYRQEDCKREAGFTLIELLAVMGIMILMASIVIGSFLGMTQGAAARSTVMHLSGVLMESRQMAIIRGKRVYVVFDQDDVNKTGGSYELCRQEGTVTFDDGVYFGDEYNDLSSLTGGGGKIYNLSTYQASGIISYNDVNNTVQTSSEIWSVGQKYGWPLGHTAYLPRGFVFVNEDGDTTCPDPLIFESDGTICDMDGNPLVNGGTIRIMERVNPDYIVGVYVEYVGSIIGRFDI